MRMVVATDDKQRGSPDPGKDGIAEDLADEASWDLPSPERIGKKRGRGRTSVGERELFLSVIEDHDRKLRMLAYRLLGDRDQMDDVLQEAYLRAYRHLDDFRGDASLSTWVYRITYNVCLDRLRSSHPDEPVDPSSIDRLNLPVAVATDPADIVGERADVAAALASLPPQQRAAVLLVDACGYDCVTASDMLGIPGGTLASRLNAARAALRTSLGYPLEREEGR